MDYLKRLGGLAESLRRTRRLRDRFIVAARQDGRTWREISIAADMSELGTRKAAIRANGGILPRPGETIEQEW